MTEQLELLTTVRTPVEVFPDEPALQASQERGRMLPAGHQAGRQVLGGVPFDVGWDVQRVEHTPASRALLEMPPQGRLGARLEDPSDERREQLDLCSM